MKTPEAIITEAVERYKPVAILVGYSGGNDSSHATHWAMNNIPGCEVFHINTGIGCDRTRQHVRGVCRAFGWPLHEVRAKEDCGMDYDEIVKKHGFPGPNSHAFMYSCLKERPIRLLVKRKKQGHPRTAKVMLISGAHHDDSVRRMRYAGKEINTVGSQLWVSPFYWTQRADRDAYLAEHVFPINPVTEELGMSGECGCGAFAQKGELPRWRKVDPAFGERIDGLSQQVLERGFTWSWEGHPPEGGFNPDQHTLFTPLCGATCYKSAIVREEVA